MLRNPGCTSLAASDHLWRCSGCPCSYCTQSNYEACFGVRRARTTRTRLGTPTGITKQLRRLKLAASVFGCQELLQEPGQPPASRHVQCKLWPWLSHHLIASHRCTVASLLPSTLIPGRTASAASNAKTSTRNRAGSLKSSIRHREPKPGKCRSLHRSTLIPWHPAVVRGFRLYLAPARKQVCLADKLFPLSQSSYSRTVYAVPTMKQGKQRHE